MIKSASSPKLQNATFTIPIDSGVTENKRSASLVAKSWSKLYKAKNQIHPHQDPFSHLITFTKSGSEVPIDEDDISLNMCCSWNSFLNVLGNRQQRYVETLRKLKINMVLLSQKLCVLETEFENFFIREESIKFTMVEIDVLIQSLNNMLGAEHINIPPEESSNWRSFTLTLVRLNRLLAERQQHSDSFQQMKGKDPIKDRIATTKATVENLLRTIETKTERRWWLRDLLNLAQLLIKAAMIIMSSISVAYNTTRFYAIITLAIIISSSLIELMDKCFLQHIRPKDIPTLPVDTPTLH